MNPFVYDINSQMCLNNCIEYNMYTYNYFIVTSSRLYTSPTILMVKYVYITCCDCTACDKCDTNV